MMRHKHRALGSFNFVYVLHHVIGRSICWASDVPNTEFPSGSYHNNFYYFPLVWGVFAIPQIPLCAKRLAFKIRVFKAGHSFFGDTVKSVGVFMASSGLKGRKNAGKGETKSFSAYYLTGIGVNIIRIL